MGNSALSCVTTTTGKQDSRQSSTSSLAATGSGARGGRAGTSAYDWRRAALHDLARGLVAVHGRRIALEGIARAQQRRLAEFGADEGQPHRQAAHQRQFLVCLPQRLADETCPDFSRLGFLAGGDLTFTESNARDVFAAAGEIDVSRPRWGEDPTALLRAIEAATQ